MTKYLFQAIGTLPNGETAYGRPCDNVEGARILFHEQYPKIGYTTIEAYTHVANLVNNEVQLVNWN